MNFFDQLDAGGRLRLPAGETAFGDLPWNRHPDFEGVELKHLITGQETGGARLLYEPGVLSILPKGEPHEVTAGPEGLRMLAKFVPALL